MVLELQPDKLRVAVSAVEAEAELHWQAALDAELTFERALFANPQLSCFRRNATTWEVLLMLAAVPEGEGPGLYEVVESVTTRALGPSALLLFLRERREEGSILFTRNPRKQSKWCLSLRSDLRMDLVELLERRARGRGL